MTTADVKKEKIIEAVRALFNDTSVSRSTTKELLEEVAGEIDVLVSSLDDDED